MVHRLPTISIFFNLIDPMSLLGCWTAFSAWTVSIWWFSKFVQVLMRALSSAPFKGYRVWWSLSDSKYGGTALMVKRQFQPKRVSFSLDPTCKWCNKIATFYHHMFCVLHDYRFLKVLSCYPSHDYHESTIFFRRDLFLLAVNDSLSLHWSENILLVCVFEIERHH